MFEEEIHKFIPMAEITEKPTKTSRKLKVAGGKVRGEDREVALQRPTEPPGRGFHWVCINGKWYQKEKKRKQRGSIFVPCTLYFSDEERLMRQLYEVVDYYEKQYGPLQDLTDEEWEAGRHAFSKEELELEWKEKKKEEEVCCLSYL